MDKHIEKLNELYEYLNKNLNYDYLITTIYGANPNYCNSTDYGFIKMEFFGELNKLLEDEKIVPSVINYMNKLIFQLGKKKEIYSKSTNSYKNKLVYNISEVIEKLEELIIPHNPLEIQAVKANPVTTNKKKQITSNLSQKQVSIIVHYLNRAKVFKPFITDIKVFESFSELTGFSQNTIKGGDNELKKNELVISEESLKEIIELFENIILNIKRDIEPKKNKVK